MHPPKGPVIFLYTRLPDYFYQCILHFTRVYGLKAVVVMYSGDANTGYHFSETDQLRLVQKEGIRDLGAFVLEQQPLAVYVAGWSDGDYRAVLKKLRASSAVNVVLGFDNPWTGALKQRLYSLLFPVMLKKYFTKIWVAGTHQYNYAQRLGYRSDDVMQGVYAADSGKYSSEQYRERVAGKKDAYPRTLLFVGRMVAYKQPVLLAEVFNELQEESPGLYGQWRLVMAGEGPLRGEIASKKYPHVSLTGFVAPEELPSLYASAGAFCIPSVEEHWGVVVQEAAFAGLPLLLSDTVYSGYSFLIQGYNGYRFISGKRASLKQSLGMLMQTSADHLWEMGQRSSVLAGRISQDTWSAELRGVLSY
ncbi:MAG: glycosyltransferase family 4 protein [Bacteroidetes bacterium]|nr:glycosyltransferase family 4 protein [Bacteroidota bacterium]